MAVVWHPAHRNLYNCWSAAGRSQRPSQSSLNLITELDTYYVGTPGWCLQGLKKAFPGKELLKCGIYMLNEALAAFWDLKQEEM